VQLGLIGLGRMGLNMSLRLMERGNHKIVGFDPRPEPRAEIEKAGGASAASLPELVSKLSAPRAVWVMVPAGKITEDTILELSNLLAPGDCIIEGGNSNYRDSQRRAALLKEKNIHFIDAGTSGGVWGRQNGYCLMVGGSKEAVDQWKPIFTTLAPEDGFLHVGDSGAGHFAKMIHNGIEYAMMQSYAEGFELMQKSAFNFDMEKVADLWNHGSVIRSWLLELAVDAFKKDHDLSELEGYVEDSGEGRWTVQTAVEQAVSAPAITAALFARFASRQDNSFGNRFLAALRNEFGGHAVKKASVALEPKKVVHNPTGDL